MHWCDEGIVLSIKKHGESSAVARVFASKHGVHGGIIKGANSKSNRGVLQPGNIIDVRWNARLSEHLGTFKAELMEPVAAHLMDDAMKLAALSSACALIESAMPERHPYIKLYQQCREFFSQLTESGDWLGDYIKLELAVLAESGFGLDLSQCAATGTTQDLVYVSPKSGRAVSREAGEPYKEKLLSLPSFLSRSGPLQAKEVAGGLQLTGYFLEHWLLAPHNHKLPAARRRLVEALTKQPLYKPSEIL